MEDHHGQTTQTLGLASYVRCVMSPDGFVLSFSGSDDLLVLDPNRFIGKEAFENPQPEVAEAFEPARWRLMTRGGPVRYRHSAVSWRGLAEIHDSVLKRQGHHLVLVCRDVTAHYRPAFRRRVATTVGRLKTAFDEDAPVCLTDGTGFVWWWPRGAERVTGIPFRWMLGRVMPVRHPFREQQATLDTPYHQASVGLYPVPLWHGLTGNLWLIRVPARTGAACSLDAHAGLDGGGPAP